MPVHQQSIKCKMSVVLHIQMFCEGMTGLQRSCSLRGKCARVEAAKFPNDSFMTSITNSGKNSPSRYFKETLKVFRTIYTHLNIERSLA